MQREETVPAEYVDNVWRAAFVGSPTGYEAYSQFDHAALAFGDIGSLQAHVQSLRARGKRHFDFGFHYPEAGGVVHKRKIALLPEKCDGATWREATEGWGLVHVQVAYEDEHIAKCRIAANTEKRAQAWSHTLTDSSDPLLWDWKAVERHARRLIRVLRHGA